MRPSRLPLLAAFSFLPLMAGCSSLPDTVSKLNPFKIDVRQGNYVTQDMVAQLKPGQTKDQVRFILGTPLVVDVFHGDRWDYVYRFKPGRGAPQQRRLIVFFEEDKLVRLAGDVVASDPNDVETKPSVRTVDIVDPNAPAKAADKPAEKEAAKEPASGDKQATPETSDK